MHKAIYLNALLEFAPDDPAHAVASDADYSAIMRDALLKAKPAWSEQSHLSAEVKRIRPEKRDPLVSNASAMGGVRLELLTYLEGEQDAPQDFAQLTAAHLQKLLEQIANPLLARHIKITLESIEENTSAVDELADDEVASNR